MKCKFVKKNREQCKLNAMNNSEYCQIHQPGKEINYKKRVEKKEARKQEILKELENTSGNISIASKRIGVTSASFYGWKEQDQEFAEKADEIIERTKREYDDYAEGKLKQHITEGNIAALIFYLKTRHPNYKLKMQLEGNMKYKEVKLTEDEQKLLNQALVYAGYKDNKQGEDKRGNSKQSESKERDS